MIDIFAVDIANPETLAMLQALYSRSHTSVLKHLEGIDLAAQRVSETELKLQEKMKKFYIGYGHESIGDCGSTTLFIENVSIIAAKAIQNTPLYSGQESSTRYIDFSSKHIDLKETLLAYHSDSYLPVKQRVDEIIDALFELYQFIHKTIVAEKTKGITDITQQELSAINAYAFDIARGFLPSGTNTQLSFHGSLRDIRTHLLTLKRHVLPEVRHLALYALRVLNAKYPNSFDLLDGHLPAEQDDILTMEECYVLVLNEEIKDKEDEYLTHINNETGINQLISDGLFDGKPKSSQLSYSAGVINVDSSFGSKTLDYGAWRDLQRHRNGFCAATIPVVRDYFITEWQWHQIVPYPEIVEKVASISRMMTALHSERAFCTPSKFELDDPFISYILPLATPICVQLSYNVQQLEYVFNLRLRETVHPSLVEYLSMVCEEVAEEIPYFKKYDSIIEMLKTRDVSLKRGSQTILVDGKPI